MEALAQLLLGAFGVTKQQLRFLFTLGFVAMTTFHILWVCGWLAFLGLQAPYAKATEVSALEQTITDERVERLDHEILVVVQSKCKASTDESRSWYAEKLNELREKYEKIAKKEPVVPRCDEV